MRILFIVRSTLYTVPGGDTVQILETAAALKDLGVEVDIRQAHEKTDYSSYHLLHFFNLIRPADILVHIRRSGKPFVITPILVDYGPYDKHHRPGLAGRLFRLMSAGRIEYAKTLYRAVSRKDRLASHAYLWKGHDNSIREILHKTRCVLVNAEEEFTKLSEMFRVSPAHAVVPNGLNDRLFKPRTDIAREEDLVLCVARIEGIKNQLNLIRALNHTRFKLLLVGKAAPNQKAYYERCRKMAGENIRFIGHLTQEELLLYYARARVHVLPSWFELCGLASLEAAAMGCRVVTTGNGYARSYFGDEAFYCDPSSPASIRDAVERASGSPVDLGSAGRISATFNWQNAAEKIFPVYQKLVTR